MAAMLCHMQSLQRLNGQKLLNSRILFNWVSNLIELFSLNRIHSWLNKGIGLFAINLHIQIKSNLFHVEVCHLLALFKFFAARSEDTKFYKKYSLELSSHHSFKNVNLQILHPNSVIALATGIILCVCPTKERQRYIVASSLIGWAHTQNDLCGRCESSIA